MGVGDLEFWKGVVQFQSFDKISVDWIISLENLM